MQKTCLKCTKPYVISRNPGERAAFQLKPENNINPLLDAIARKLEVTEERVICLDCLSEMAGSEEFEMYEDNTYRQRIKEMKRRYNKGRLEAEVFK